MKRFIFTVIAVIICMFTVNITAFATEENIDLTVNTSNKEADEVFNTYLETAMLMDGDTRFSTMFVACRATGASEYVKYTGGTKEEWNSFSDMEVFFWYTLYLEQIGRLESGSYEYFYGTIDKFRQSALTVRHFLKTDEKQLDAYYKIMDWQYEYITTHGVPYNFMTGEAYSYFTEHTTEAASTSAAEIEESETNESIISTTESVSATTTENEEEKETGIWEDVIDGLKDNIVVIIIAIALAIGFLVVYIMRKKKNQ